MTTTNATLTDYRAEWARQAAEQETVNSVAWWVSDKPETVRAMIAGIAAVAHAQYPQYAGEWIGPEWRLAKVTRTQTGKGGDQFLKGDIVIVRALADDPILATYPEHASATAYSVRLGWDCAIRPENYEVIA